MLAAPEGFAPLSGWDAFPIHQSVAPIRYVDTTDSRAFERYWFTAQAKNAAFFLVFGMGFYPSLGFADAYVLLTRRDRQVTVLRFTHTYVTAFLRCAGYSGPDGRGTPRGNHHHGEDSGGIVTSDVHDLPCRVAG